MVNTIEFHLVAELAPDVLNHNEVELAINKHNNLIWILIRNKHTSEINKMITTLYNKKNKSGCG